jgi:hypothetical protein
MVKLCTLDQFDVAPPLFVTPIAPYIEKSLDLLFPDAIMLGQM